MVAQSYTGGVKPMSIAGRYINERERLYGMTDAERAFRKQWLQDQVLSHNEPREVPELYKALHNPIRRFYRWPLDQLQAKLTTSIGFEPAHLIRRVLGRGTLFVFGVYWFAYYAKYNSNDWTRKGGWSAKVAKEAVELGDPQFPKVSEKTKPSDYATRGFDKNTLKL